MTENKIIDGKEISAQIREKVKEFGETLKKESGRTPGLAVVLVGENPASKVYVKNKIEKTKEVGFTSIEHRLNDDVSEEELLNVVKNLNEDDKGSLEENNQLIKIVKDMTSKGFVRNDYKRKLVDLSDIRINLKGKK